MLFARPAVQCVESCATASDVNDHGHRVKEMALQADTDRTVRPEDFAEETSEYPRHAFHTIRRGTWLLASAALAATLLAACDGGTSKRSAPSPPISPPMSLGAAARSGTARLRRRNPVRLPGDRRRRNRCGSAPSRLGDRAIRGREHTDCAPPTTPRGRPNPDAGLWCRPQPGSGVDSAMGGVRRDERYHVVADGGAPRRQAAPTGSRRGWWPRWRNGARSWRGRRSEQAPSAWSLAISMRTGNGWPQPCPAASAAGAIASTR